MLQLLPLLLGLSFQLPEDPGAYVVGWRDQNFQDLRFGQGTVAVRIYYPANTPGQNAPANSAGGPYPVVGFQHGWLGSASNYDNLCTHIASWGYVVASTNTETGLFPDRQAFARDTRAALWWVEDQSALPSSWLTGMADPLAPWSAMGHSMGGGTLSLLVGIEPRVRAIVGLQAAPEPAGVSAMLAFTGSAWWIAGSEDNLVPPSDVHDWFERSSVSSQRNLYWVVHGMGHSGCVDVLPNGEPLSGPEQFRVHRRLTVAILESEVRSEENQLSTTLGAGASGQPWTAESDCQSPPVWAIEGGASIFVGVAGRIGGKAAVAWSLALGNYTTPYGPLGFDPRTAVRAGNGPANSEGSYEVIVPPHPSWLGRTIGFAGLAAGGGRSTQLGRTALVDYP